MKMIDFADHFWNMKCGQTSVKELADFLKERSLIEDEYQKHLSKLIKQMLNFGAVGTFSAFWVVVKSSLEKILQLHSSLIQQLHDVAKDVHKYGEEQQKAHKSVREADAKTMEAVNLMQTTTTCLQKSKENYTSRCVEHEKLKRENAPVKEVQKSENRLKKAADEYRQYIEKYGKIRDNYEQRMIASSRVNNFQEFEANHLNQMKQLTLGCAFAFEGSQNEIFQASLEFRRQIENINVEEILRDFAAKKGTGAERPNFAAFEEPDLNVLLPVSDSNASLFAPVEDASSAVALSALSDAPSVVASDSSVLTLDYTNDSAKQIPIANGPSSNSGQQTANRKLPVWLPGRKKTSQSNSKLATPTQSPSGDGSVIANASNEGGGFLRKKKDASGSKKKKDKESADNKSEVSSEDAKSQSSGGKNPNSLMGDLIVDEEGYTVRPDNDVVRPDKINESSSEDDSADEYEPKKIQIEIKQHPIRSISASVDELKDAIKDVNVGLYAGLGSRQRLSKDSSLDDFDPMKTTDPWNNAVSSSSRNREPLRPAKTGDDRYNRSNFVGLQWPASAAPPPSGDKDSPWSADEGGDTLTRLVGSVSWSAAAAPLARARPRSSTPTQSSIGGDVQMSFNASQSANDSWGANRRQSVGREDSFESSPSSLSTLSFASSPGGAAIRSEPAPLAVALTETVHVLFKGSNLTGCVIKVYGNLAVSFPASLAQTLTDNGRRVSLPALIVKLANADKIHTLMPNRQVLTKESIFKSDSCHEFPFDMHSLSTYLKQRIAQSPSGQFFNLDILRYEVRAEPDGNSAPLQLQSYWKCQPSQTDIVVQYNYNQSCPITAPLLNIQFSTRVDGEITQAQLKPEGSWISEDNRLIWKMTELSRHGESAGSLKARLTAVDGPSTPSQTVANFQMNDACLSGADVQLVGSGYRISLLKKKIVAGRYLCEPEPR